MRQTEEVYKGAHREVRLWPGSPGDNEGYPRPQESQAFREHIEREGFVVVRQAVPGPVCEAALAAFRSGIKRSRYPFLRHEADVWQPHVFTEAGHMKYPILNVQDLPRFRFRSARKIILDLMTHPHIQRAIESAFGEPGQLVQTMIFEGNQNTWPHRDGRYVDSEQKGKLLGVIVAAEDIHRGAGRFYICPRSNLTPIKGEQEGPNADPNSQSYKSLISDFVVNGPLECVAPILNQGDMLIWTSMTIHGSLATANPAFSRSTFNAHWVPASQSLRMMGGSPKRSPSFRVNGVHVVTFGGQYSTLKAMKKALKSRFPGIVPAVRSARAVFRDRS